jgi:hypothetical protein
MAENLCHNFAAHHATGLVRPVGGELFLNEEDERNATGSEEGQEA